MTKLIWAERLLLGALLLFAIAAGSVSGWLFAAGLLVWAGCARILIVDANARPRALSPLEQRQRESLAAGRWT